MPPTRDFTETVRERAQEEPEFRKELLKEAVRCMLNGEADIGEDLLRDYVNSGRSPESLMHMFSDNGNPSADDLLGILAAIAERENIKFDVRVRPRRRSEEPVEA